MGNSRMYNEFNEWHRKIGTREGDYFLPYRFLEEFSDRERNEVETVMYEDLKNNRDGTGYFCIYMKYLKNYDGVAALEDYIQEYTKIGNNRFDVIAALYEVNFDSKYVDMMMDLYKKTRKRIFVSKLKYCTPSEAVFNALKYIYVNDADDMNRSVAKMGLLYGKGYIKDFFSYGKPNEEEMKLRRLFSTDDINERMMLVEKLATNQQLIEGIPVPEPFF